MKKIYILQTDRLYLRQYQEEDFDSLHAIFADPDTMAYYPAPFSPQKTRQWIERNRERYEQAGYGLWAVCLTETGECIGDCGLVNQEVDGIVEVEIVVLQKKSDSQRRRNSLFSIERILFMPELPYQCTNKLPALASAAFFVQ